MNSTGVLGEHIAARYLREKQYSILERNFHIRGGEIDLIALDNRVLVFVEVKTRTQKEFGAGREFLTFRKKKALRRTMQTYIQGGHFNKHAPGAQYQFRFATIRFDLIDIELDLKKNKILTFTHYKNIALA